MDTDMENLPKPPKAAKPRQPSKLDDAPLIPLADFENVMREALTVTPEEVARREAEYQRGQEAKRKTQKRLSQPQV